MKGILSKYITIHFLRCFVSVFFCVFLIVGVLEGMEVVRKYFSNSINISAYQIVKITLFHSIYSTCSFFSFVVLLSSIVSYTVLHIRLELTSMKVLGVSTSDVIKSFCVGVSIIGAIYVSVWDGLSAYSVNKINSLDHRLRQESSNDVDKSLTVTNTGVWLRDNVEYGSCIISAKSFDSKNASLFNLRIFEFNQDGNFDKTIYAKTGTIEGQAWRLKSCKIATSDGREFEKEEYILPSNLSFSNINRMIANPGSVSFWSIQKCIKMLENVGLSTIRYKIHWCSRIATILQCFAFVFLSTVFCIDYNNRDNKRYMVKVAILISLAFPIQFFNSLLTAFSESGIVPIFFGVFILPISIIGIGSVLAFRK